MLRATDTVQRTDTGRHRSGNEDSSYARAPLFVLADGMGGAAAGEVASHIAIEAFAAGLPENGTPEERLSVVIQRANRAIYDQSQANQRLRGMGTTVTAVYLDTDHVALAHVGDSRAYRLRDGELTRLTEDHSMVEELVRDGKLTEEQAFEHPQRSIITRSVGVEQIVEVDTVSYPTRAGDVFMLCSDGLTDMLPERYVGELLVAAPDLEQAAQRLIDEANNAGGRDNITVVMFRVEDASMVPAEDPSSTAIMPAAEAAAGGYPSASTEGAPRQATPAPAVAGGTGFGADRLVGRATTKLPLARTQGPAGVSGRRQLGRFGKTMAALVTILVLLFFFGAGGYLASRQLYFIGTDEQGTVVVYRGFPYKLPFGIPMYETYYISGVPASLIPADRRTAFLNHELHSETSSFKLINDLELGKISG